MVVPTLQAPSKRGVVLLFGIVAYLCFLAVVLASMGSFARLFRDRRPRR